MTTKTITLDPQVAFEESAALVEFYRNRTLLLAQTAFDHRNERDALRAQIEAMAPPADPAEMEAKH